MNKEETLSALIWSVLKEKNPKAVLIDMGVLDNGAVFVDIDEITYSEKDFEDTEKGVKEMIDKGFSESDLKEKVGKDISAMGSDKLTNIAFNIFSVSGVYIDGNEENKQVTRIRAWVASSPQELEEFLNNREKEQAFDHRTLNESLKLYEISENVGKGLPLYTDKGTTLKRVLERFIVDEELRRGYTHVSTPEITNTKLYEKSGHIHFYKDSMFAPMDIDGEKFVLRPMTCPHHFELYLTQPKSYRDLPLRYAEIARLYRYEKSGELSGLTRVRGFTLSDAHIFCADRKQAMEEVATVLNFIEYINTNIFKLEPNEDYWYRLSLGDSNDPEKYAQDGEVTIEDWKDAEDALREVLNERDIRFVESEGEAAFYGPKIDIQMRSVTGKEDTAFTVQWDFLMPKRFNLTYKGNDGEQHETIVIHRSSIGATERLIAFLTEKYKGEYPFWLSPIQARVINIQDEVISFADNAYSALLDAGIRVEKDYSKERIGTKIHEAKKSLVPYIIVIGKKDMENNVVTVESRDGEKEQMSIEDLVKKMTSENVPDTSHS